MRWMFALLRGRREDGPDVDEDTEDSGDEDGQW